MLEKLGMFDAVDFENCLISHRANAVGTFATIIQTIFANKMMLSIFFILISPYIYFLIKYLSCFLKFP